MTKNGIALALLAGLVYAAASEPAPRQEVINGLKDLQRELGFKETRNFLQHAPGKKAFYRCYYTEKLQLPDNYEELGYKEGKESGCDLDPEKYDVFFYAMEAEASGKNPVTSSLEESPLERFLVVVPHEDFHHQADGSSLPLAIPEAASTLIGFYTAMEYARQNYGADSETYRKLSQEPALFLQKASLINQYHARLGNLYASAKSGSISTKNALENREKLFEEIGKQCEAIAPAPNSFNKCPAVVNNAGITFDFTYTRYYPLMHELYVAHGEDLKATIETLKPVLATKTMKEREAAAYLQNIARQKRAARHQ